MQPVPTGLVQELELDRAFNEEMGAWRSLMPEEPWRDAVRNSGEEISGWLHTRLIAGDMNAQNLVVSARKAGHGTRPVAVMGLPERVAYRALALYVLQDDPLPDRSPSAYRNFVLGPVESGLRITSENGRVAVETSFQYVVEADITAFYHYIDHELLRQELHLQTGRVVEVGYLLQLLQECEGRSFGVPQLYEPSDWLSDYYAAIIERDLARRGLSVWRYNDDFRIGTGGYGAALDAVESLEDAARAVGLVVNSYKTYTYAFMKYVLKNTGVDVSDAEATIDPHDVEAIVADYVHIGETEALAAAQATLRRLESDSRDPSHIDITQVRGDEFKDLRRAFGSLSRNRVPDGLPWVRRLFQFVPSLTPRLVQYLLTLGDEHLEEVTEVLVGLREYSFASEWQVMWVISAIRQLDVAVDDDTRRWLGAQRERGRGGVLAAEAALTLARTGTLEFDDLDQALRMEPEALGPWYLLAMKELSHVSDGHGARLAAVRAMSPLNQAILSD